MSTQHTPLCGANAAAWASEFNRHKIINNWHANDIDESLMLGWFANVIEQTKQVGTDPGYFDGRPFNADIAVCKITDAVEEGVLDDVDAVTALRLWREGAWGEFFDFISED